MLAQGRIYLDGKRAESISEQVGQFTHVTLDQRVLQCARARYVMLHKPPGVVSATRDEAHRTVLDFISAPFARELHIVGRLDLNSTGLMLLTNDGRWSRAISRPEENIIKTYRVRLAQSLTPDYVSAFEQGMYFAFEDKWTRPAQLRILSEFEAEIDLVEGRYHQIKRMFGRFDNPVLELHRISVGSLRLDPVLGQGQWRELYEEELDALGLAHAGRPGANPT